MLDGNPDGKGKMVFSDGRVYEGDWSNKNINGNGIMTHPNGYIYKGRWVDGHIVHGERINKAGDFYYGAFVNDLFEDEKAIYKWKNGGNLTAKFSGGKQVRSKGKYIYSYDCYAEAIYEDYFAVADLKTYGECSAFHTVNEKK